MGDVFLSYKSQDRPRAARVVAALEAEGIKVWWDQNLGVGDSWRHQLGERLDQSRCVIVLWSARAAGPEGSFVQDEAARAARRGTYLPVLLDHVEMPLGFGSVQALLLVDWHGDASAPAFRTLIAKVRALLATDTTKTTVSGAPADQPPAGPRPRTDPPGPTPGLSRRTMLRAAGGVALAGSGVALLLSPAARRAVGLPPAASGPVRLAVLPFRPLANGERAALLAEGLTEELRTALARSGLIQVAARTSSNSFAGSDVGTREIARRLGVDWLLAGSVRTTDARARVSAALAEADTGLETWNDSFDHAMDDIIAMQQGIATSVATALVGTLGPEAAAATGRVPTQSTEAYGAYLRGQRLLDQATDLATDRKALAEFDTAVQHDPAFAAAHASRARALQAIASAAVARTEQDAATAMALAAARRAVTLDPDLPAAHSTLGFVLMYGLLDFPAARPAFEEAYSLAPRDPDILIRHGLYHARAGSMETGLRSLSDATRLDPYSPRAYRAHAFALLAARRHADSIAEVEKGLALNPSLSAAQATIGDNALAKGDVPRALEAYARETQDFSRLAGLAIAHHRAGNRPAADAAFTALQALGETVEYQQGQVLAQWGRADDAVAALERAVVRRDGGVALMRNDPFLDPLRARPGFQALIGQLQFA